MAREGEKNGKAGLKDWQALHIKCIYYVEFEGKNVGAAIKYIRRFYPLKYNTIYDVIFRNYKHLDKWN